MLFSENVYFLILFTLPAAMNIIYNAHVRHTPVAKPDKSIELAECIIFCFVVFMVNILFLHNDMRLFAQYNVLNDIEKKEFVEETDFQYIDFMIKYFVSNIIVSFVVIVFWYTLGQWCFRNLKNILNDIRNSPRELKFSDVWSNVFETSEYVNWDDCIIRIEKGGNLVTAGVVSVYSPPNLEKKEFLLSDTDLVKQIFEDDEKLSFDLRLFKQADYEYYNIESDILIKFYNTKLYRKAYGE